MMSAGPFRRAAAIAFSSSSKPKSQSPADDGIGPDHCPFPVVVSSIQNANADQRPAGLDKKRCTTKPNKTMSFLPPIPFTVGSWSGKEENVLNIGQRIRRKRPATKKEESPTVLAQDEKDRGKARTRPLGPSLPKVHENVSRLWKRKSHIPTETSSSMATGQDDHHVTQSKDSLHNETKREQVLPENSIQTETTKASRTSSSSSIPMRLFHQFRKRNVGRPYSCLREKDDRQEKRRMPCHNQDSELESHEQMALSNPLMDGETMDSLPAILSHPLSIPTDSNAEPDLDESVMDMDTTAGVQPSVADSAMDSSLCLDEEPLLEPWEPPKPKKRKPRKPRHGDDSVLIGLIITFDPTAELLNLGNAPQCISKTFLSELQKNDDYQGQLLGDWKDEEEEDEEVATEELPSFSELLGFHLDCFEPPPAIDTSWDEEPKYPAQEGEEEINFVFQHGLDDSDILISNIIEQPEGAESDEEEIEIVFYPVDHIHCPEDEEEGVSQASSTKHGSDIDCQSHSSEGSVLPLEWMLPKHSMKVVTSGSLLFLDPPEYEWFHPDHQDVELTNHHTPHVLFGALFDEKHRSSVTPSTVGETLSFDVQTSFDGSEESGVLSSGSLPSEAVQSLVEFCHLTVTTDTCTSEYLHHYQGLFPNVVTPTMSIISQGIDF